MENKFLIAIGALIIGLLIIAISSVILGTVLYVIWEDSVTAMFPSSVENGILASKLTWWQCVKISWVFSILIKSTNTETK
jgi:hypothetical protein